MPVDLRSDTVTRPTPAMLAAMMAAEVGDDVLGDDPSVHALEAHAAELAGMEAAVFTPSGTMANQIAIRCWTQPGDEVLMEAGAHPYHYEAGAAAAVSGVQTKLLAGLQGILAPEAVDAAIRPEDDHFAPATMLVIENTANRGGGAVYPLEILEGHVDAARRHGLKLHMDGARVFNAAVTQGVSLRTLTTGFDSISFCLSKGLGAPVGSLLCGPAPVIARARRIRKMLGGGMRQAGFMAAAGLHALRHHIDRLADDHRRADTLRDGLAAMGLDLAPAPTNMVYAGVADAHEVVAGVAEQGVLCLAVAPDRIRLVTHLDVDDAGIDQTLAAFGAVLATR